MPFDSNGNATITRNRAVTGQTVQAAQVNTPFDDVQSMLSQVLLRSGVAPMTGPLNMNGFKITGAADGVASTDMATVGQVQSAAPIGSVISFAGSSAPTGWMLCAGQTLSRTTYASLFSVIGESFGAGDGSTTFRLPDCRGRVEVGKDDMGGADAARLSFFGSVAKIIGGVFGTASHVLSEGQMPRHQHGGTTSTNGSHNHGYPADNGSPGNNIWQSGLRSQQTNFTDVAGDHFHNITTDFRGNNEAHTNAQPSIVFNKIIKVT